MLPAGCGSPGATSTGMAAPTLLRPCNAPRSTVAGASLEPEGCRGVRAVFARGVRPFTLRWEWRPAERAGGAGELGRSLGSGSRPVGRSSSSAALSTPGLTKSGTDDTADAAAADDDDDDELSSSHNPSESSGSNDRRCWFHRSIACEDDPGSSSSSGTRPTGARGVRARCLSRGLGSFDKVSRILATAALSVTSALARGVRVCSTFPTPPAPPRASHPAIERGIGVRGGAGSMKVITSEKETRFLPRATSA